MVMLLALAGCAATPAPVMTPDQEYDPESVLPATPMIESPPIEPIETLLPEPPPAAASPAAPVASPPSTQSPEAPATQVAPPAIEPTADQQMLTLLADLQRYGTLQNDDLKRELTAATQTFSRQRTDISRVRLAVLYTLLRTSAQDDQRALQLFENVAKNAPAESAIRRLAAVLQMQVVERQRAVRDEQQKADAAIQKLEALREMERSLLRDRVRSGGGGGTGGAGGSGR
jgi:hypothetical protein